jgi:preprotein translocase subunit Sec63
MLKFLKASRQGLIRKQAYRFSVQGDPYFILGVEKETPFQEIKAAFYKLANEFHPDKNDSKVLFVETSSKPIKNSSFSNKLSK